MKTAEALAACFSFHRAAPACTIRGPHRTVNFSIVTPSLNQLPWLKRAARSVADQGVEVQHIVQDGGSGPELERWVREQTRAEFESAPDRGIYDALNAGFRRATGDICAWLNCDEQYLPGALEKVRAVFESDRTVDFVVGDFLLVDPRGELLAFRRATPLRASMVLTDHLYDFTCATFFRRDVWLKRPFMPAFKVAGDAEWIARSLRRGAKVRYLREYLAVFTITGENLSQRADLREDAKLLRQFTPLWMRLAKPLLRQARHVEKLLAGGYWSGPIRYEIFAGEDDTTRREFRCERPTFRHPWA